MWSHFSEFASLKTILVDILILGRRKVIPDGKSWETIRNAGFYKEVNMHVNVDEQWSIKQNFNISWAKIFRIKSKTTIAYKLRKGVKGMKRTLEGEQR